MEMEEVDPAVLLFAKIRRLMLAVGFIVLISIEILCVIKISHLG